MDLDWIPRTIRGSGVTSGRRQALTALIAGATASLVTGPGSQAKKHKKKCKKCQTCQEPETCPDRVCCECNAQSPMPGCHIVGLATNPTPAEATAACDQACGGPGTWSGGNTSYTAGGLTIACDADSHCVRVLCPI